MHIVDFRIRPNTDTYMSMYEDPSEWHKLGFPRPTPAPLESFLQDLDNADVSLAVFAGCDTFHGTLPDEYVVESVKASSGRLVGMSGIDPLKGASAVEQIRRSAPLGLKGVALDPYCIEKTADDPVFDPIYAVCQELDLPVVITMGPFTGRWGEPKAVADVATRYPRLTIVCSHGVWPQATDFIALAYVHDNVYLETSAYIAMPGAQLVLDAAKTILADKVIYASAFPFRPLNDHTFIREYGLPEAVLEKILFRNALKLLKMT